MGRFFVYLVDSFEDKCKCMCGELNPFGFRPNRSLYVNIVINSFGNYINNKVTNKVKIPCLRWGKTGEGVVECFGPEILVSLRQMELYFNTSSVENVNNL